MVFSWFEVCVVTVVVTDAAGNLLSAYVEGCVVCTSSE